MSNTIVRIPASISNNVRSETGTVGAAGLAIADGSLTAAASANANIGFKDLYATGLSQAKVNVGEPVVISAGDADALIGALSGVTSKQVSDGSSQTATAEAAGIGKAGGTITADAAANAGVGTL